MPPSLELFLAESRPRLLRMATLLCGDVHSGEDLLQDAFEKLSKRWSSIDENPDGYARRVIASLAADRWRVRLRREEIMRGGLFPAVWRDESEVSNPSDDRLIILAALRRLPRRQRAVIVLRFYVDMTEADTATTLGISVSSVKQHVRRAAASLRRDLAHEFPQLGYSAMDRP